MTADGTVASVAPPTASRAAAAVAALLFGAIAAFVGVPLARVLLLPALATGAWPAGWSAATALGVVALCLGTLAALGVTLRQRLRTRLDDDGVVLPMLRSERRIPWSAIDRVSGRGLQVRLHAGPTTVTVNPLCYARPGEVVPYLLGRLPRHRVGSVRGG